MKEKKCLCTVLLITYNHRKYIERALKSILMQKTEYEFVVKVFDDGSTDGTREIVRKYAEKRPDKIEIHFNERNVGAQKNYLNAYKSVETPYCAILEGDDYWCDDRKIQMQIQTLEKHPECSFCAHNTIYENINDIYRKKEDGNLMVYNRNVRRTGIYDDEDFILLHGAGFMNHLNSRMIRMSCVEWDKLEDVEDFLYDNCQFFYLLQKGKLYFIEYAMSVYSMNMSSSFSSLQVMTKIKEHSRRMVHINQSTNGVYERLIYRHLASFTTYWLKLDDYQSGISEEHSDLYLAIARIIRSIKYDKRYNRMLKQRAMKFIKKLKIKEG